MFFKKSKKKQLADMKHKVYMMRAGMEVQKEHAVLLARHTKKEDFPKTIERIYDYMIKELREIENT